MPWKWSAYFYSVKWMLFRSLWGAALLLVGGLLGLGLLLPIA